MLVTLTDALILFLIGVLLSPVKNPALDLTHGVFQWWRHQCCADSAWLPQTRYLEIILPSGAKIGRCITVKAGWTRIVLLGEDASEFALPRRLLGQCVPRLITKAAPMTICR